MNFNPNNFYIGIIDLFAIFLPGAIVTFSLYYFFQVETEQVLCTFGDNTEFVSVMTFFISSYLFGHIVFRIGSYLDDYIYDPLKKKKLLAKDQRALEQVKDIRRTTYHNSDQDLDVVNTFEWSYFRVARISNDAISEIDRYLADSKFFRGLIIVMLFEIPFLLNKGFWIVVIISGLVMIFSLFQYFEKRTEATKTLYKYVIYYEKHPDKKTD